MQFGTEGVLPLRRRAIAAFRRARLGTANTTSFRELVMTHFPARLIVSVGLITAVGFGRKPEPSVTPSTLPRAESAKPAEKTANGKEEA